MGLFGISWGFIVGFFGVIALIGTIVGIFSGLILSLFTRPAHHERWKDAVIGGVGALAAYLGAMLLPWPERTIHRPIGAGSEMTETISTFPHPFLAAWFVAALMPVLWGFWNWRKRSVP